MKVSVRLIGDGLARADALVSDIRRRALARLQARVAERVESARAAHKQQPETPQRTR